MNDYDVVIEMLRRHNTGEIELNDIEAERLAMKAKSMGERFDVESRPLAKGAFDMADMAVFGLLPNEWRPTSQGQNIFGESAIDRVAGGAGSLLGLGTGIYGGVKASKAGWGALKKIFARKKADDIAGSVYKGNLLGPGPRIQQLGPGRGTPQLSGRPPQLLGRPPQLPGGGRYPLQTTPNIGATGRGMFSRRSELEEAMRQLGGTGYGSTGYGTTGYGSTGYGSSGYQMGGMMPRRQPMGAPGMTPGMNPVMGAGMNPGMGGGMQPIGGMQPSANPNMLPQRRPMSMQEGGWQPDMMDEVSVQAPRLSMRDISERQRKRDMYERMYEQTPMGPAGQGLFGPQGEQSMDDWMMKLMNEKAGRTPPQRGGGMLAPPDSSNRRGSLMDEYRKHQKGMGQI